MVLKALLNVNEKFNTTCFIITHNAAIAELAHRVIYFADGNVSHVAVNNNRKKPDEIDW